MVSGRPVPQSGRDGINNGDGAQGYLMTDARGSVYNFSSVAVPGLQPGYDRPDPVVAIAAAPDGPGCWLLQRDGKVFAAPASLFLAESPARNGWTAVDIAPTPSGHGSTAAACTDGGDDQVPGAL